MSARRIKRCPTQTGSKRSERRRTARTRNSDIRRESLRMANANNRFDDLALSLRRWERPDTTLRLVETSRDDLATVHGELERVVESLAQERVRLKKLT